MMMRCVAGAVRMCKLLIYMRDANIHRIVVMCGWLTRRFGREIVKAWHSMVDYSMLTRHSRQGHVIESTSLSGDERQMPGLFLSSLTQCMCATGDRLPMILIEYYFWDLY